VSDRFLTIDVSSELATLCEAQLRGTWQVPAELVRLAVRIGATEVSVRSRKHSFDISWQGPTIDDEVLADLRSALDTDLGPDHRQRAIAALEEPGMEAVLWAAGLRGARLRIACSDASRRWVFEDRRRRGLKSKKGPGSDEAKSVVIQWRCAGLDQRRAIRWLAIASRFATARILVDGTALPTGFVGGLYHLQLEEPVPCRLGLTRSGEEPVLWLLRDGVVSARASVPGYPPFEAAVELGGKVAPGASAADMRRAVTPFVGDLVDRAVWMMVQVSDRLSEMAAGDRDRVGLLLLRAAHKGIRAREICRLPLLKTASNHDLRLSVEGIRQLADQRGGMLAAIDAGEKPTGDLLDPQSTLLASSEVRHLLAGLTGVRFQSPSRRHQSFCRGITDRFRATADHLRQRARGVFARREVPPGELRPLETDLLTAILTAVAPLNVSLCEGQGSAGWTAGGVVVPRAHPALKAGADLVSGDSTWLYPILLALEMGQETPHDLRRRWLETQDLSPPKYDPDHALK
jgi:hypothetical protein